MKILSIETSGKICAVALANNETILLEKQIEDENTHSVKLMPLVQDILQEAHLTIQDIGLFACDIGPGSFTGIRIGVATVKAFLDATHQKAVGVTALESLAYQIKTDALVCCLIDAKNNHVYTGFFKKEINEYRPIEEPTFASIDEVIEKAKQKNEKIVFVGNGSILYQDKIELNLEKAEVISSTEANKLNAKNIAYVAYLKKDKAVDSHELQPIYLRKSNAER